MKSEKLIVNSNLNIFKNEIMTKEATQDKLTELEMKLIEKIAELNEKLEIVKNKQWKFKVGDIVIHDKFVFEITELIDDSKWLYKARKYDFAGVIDKAGFSLPKETTENCYFDTNDNLIKLTHWTDYAAQLLKLAVKREKEILK